VPVSIDGHTEYIEGSPKSLHSLRELALPLFAIEALEFHRTAQRQYRLKMDSRWVDMDLVFTNGSGYYLNRNTITSQFRKILRKTAGIPDDLKNMGLHGLRHTSASILLAQGIPVTIVQQRLGHASPDVTLKVYAHALPGGQEIAMEGLNTLVQNFTNGVR
jgi:integrase